MFDRNDPADLLALKNEVNNNLAHYGDDLGNTNAILDGLNVVANARTSPTVFKPKVSAAVIRSETYYDAYNTLIQDEQEYLQWITGSNGFEEENISANSELREFFYGGTATPGDPAWQESNNDSAWNAANRVIMNNRMRAVFEKAATEAEGLFGFGTVITRDDWFAARDS